MKIIKLLNKNILWLIILLAAIIRVWNLGNIPPHLTPDEASLGYNAYSILKTGKDEYGKTLPLIFKSFGDYKPGLYIYATVPFVAVLGLSEFSVRLPSAIFGIISVYLIYLIANRFFGKKFAMFAGFIGVFNPWLIYFSRGAWEVNLSLTLTLAGIYFFLKSLEKNKFLILSSLFFALTLLTYQGAKLSSGLVIILLLFFYFKDLIKFPKKYLTQSLLLGLLISFPIILSMFTGLTGRLEVFSVFSYPRPKEYLQSMLDEGGEKIGSLSYYLFHSEDLNFKRGIMGRWFNHFSGKFLFFEGDFSNPRHSAPYQGMLLLSDLVILILGFFEIFKNRLKKEHLFFIFWLILAPLPAVLSRDQVHAVRSFNMAIPLIIICTFGLNGLVTFIDKNKYKVYFYSVVFLVYLVSIIYFLDSYFVHVPTHNSKLWSYGYKQVVETVTPIQGNYKKIVVQQSFAQPYIFFLFFQKYDPFKYQKNTSFVNSEYIGDVGYITKLDNIEFGPIDWSVNRGDRGTLFVADTLRIPPADSINEKEFKLIREIKYLNNRDTAFRIIEVK
ncbi:MAG: glycosyltransferase family 39 protein [Candidatus Woesebacteria bacterium]|nr:glycosyltransferase family 39 protein [Candidatus Woesebacteria bacterium]